MNEKYVIIGKNASGEIRYLAYDISSGGYLSSGSLTDHDVAALIKIAQGGQ